LIAASLLISQYSGRARWKGVVIAVILSPIMVLYGVMFERAMGEIKFEIDMK